MDTVVHGLGTSRYRVSWALNQRMIRLSGKMLCGESVNRYSGSYRYALFCHSFGFILRRKNLALPPQEQSWQDVVKLEPVD